MHPNPLHSVPSWTHSKNHRRNYKHSIFVFVGFAQGLIVKEVGVCQEWVEMTKLLIPAVVILTTVLKLTTGLVSNAEPALDILAENDDSDFSDIPIVQDVEA